MLFTTDEPTVGAIPYCLSSDCHVIVSDGLLEDGKRNASNLRSTIGGMLYINSVLLVAMWKTTNG